VLMWGLAVFALITVGSACSNGGSDRVDAGGTGTAAQGGASNDFIEVSAPVRGAPITSPVTVTGQNRTFENTVRIRIVGADGSTLADVFTTGNGRAPGEWGQFAAPVAFSKGTNANGTIVVFEDSPKDGSEIHVLEIPVKFA
jgi:hypothetical protein